MMRLVFLPIRSRAQTQNNFQFFVRKAGGDFLAARMCVALDLRYER